MDFITNAYWDIGRRLENQDSLATHTLLTSRGRIMTAIVCDGVGGLNQGAYASGTVVEEMLEWYYDQFITLFCNNKSTQMLKRSCLKKIYQVYERLHADVLSENICIGTTMTLLLFWKKQYLLIHIGDSRAYLLRKKGIKQLTQDHRTDSGALSKCMNSTAFQMPDVLHGRVKKGDHFLLCTDGFVNKIEDHVLWEVLFEKKNKSWKENRQAMEQKMERRLREIAEHNYKKGEKDNSSAIYITLR